MSQETATRIPLHLFSWSLSAPFGFIHSGSDISEHNPCKAFGCVSPWQPHEWQPFSSIAPLVQSGCLFEALSKYMLLNPFIIYFYKQETRTFSFTLQRFFILRTGCASASSWSNVAKPDQIWRHQCTILLPLQQNSIRNLSKLTGRVWNEICTTDSCR